MEINSSNNIGNKNITFGWIWILTGILVGAVLGMWSFNGPFPTPVGDYTDLPRRMLRLSHIAFIALAIINILYGYEINNKSKLKLKTKNTGSVLMIFGAILMPVILILSALVNESFKYLTTIPATLLIISLLIIITHRIKKQNFSN